VSELIEITIKIAAVIGALSVIGGVFALIFKIRDWVIKQGEQEAEIKKIKDENCLLCYGLSACLDGLMQLGANHTVPVAKEKLDKYINQQAHN